jgi:hypothetical protein
MKARCLVLLIALYVSMDLSNPWMPGAFVFDADDSVDGLSARRDEARVTDVGRAGAHLARRHRLAPIGLTSLRQAPPVRPRSVWGGAPRRAHAPSPDPAPSGDDH